MKRLQIEVRKNPKRLCKREMKPQTPMGLFNCLPEEITQHLLSHYIPLECMASFSMMSKSMCSYIRELGIDTQLTIRPINGWIETHSYAKIKKRFIDIGMLLKTTSALLNTTEKLSVIEVFLYELEETYHKICEKISLKFAYDCIGLFLYKFIAKWDEAALKRTFTLIEKLSRLSQRIDKVIHSKPGAEPRYERDIRQFIHEVFLKKAISPEQRSLWLWLVMELYPTHHSQLLYLLYGPLEKNNGECTGMIDWRSLCSCSSFHTGCSSRNFKDLSDIINLIAGSRRFSWSDSVMIKFFNELTSTPEPWCLENCAKLMFMLGHNLSVKILQSKLNMDQVSEFSHIVYHLAQVSSQNSCESGFSESMSWFVKVLFEAIRTLAVPSKRSYVINEIFKAWRENIQALTDELEDPFDEDDVREDLRITTDNLAFFTQILMEIIMNNKDDRFCLTIHSRNEE